MQRFYFPEADYSQNSFILRDIDIIYQLKKVLRTRIWDKIIFFDWKINIDYLCKINEIKNKEAFFTIEEKIEKELDNDFSMNLFQAIPNKLSKLEFIFQKWVEVWYDSFTLFTSNRSQKLFLSEKKIERLNKIIIEAVEQSGRNIIPVLKIEEDISEININGNYKSLFFHTNKLNSIKLNELKEIKEKDINILVWPEWWWDEEEENYFTNLRVKKVYLWNNILRTETVGIVVWFFLKQKY